MEMRLLLVCLLVFSVGPAWAQVFVTASGVTCTADPRLATPVQGRSVCFESTTNAWKGWDGTRWQTDAALATASINVKDYGAKGDGVADDTTAIQAAIIAAKASAATQTEVAIVWPAGSYNVTSVNYVGASRIRNIALGAVNIYGTSAGGTSILNIDGAQTTVTTGLRFDGYFAVQIKLGVGATYQYGIRMSFVHNSFLEFHASGAYSVNTMYVDYSWDNTFPLLDLSNSATNATVLRCGPNSVNKNRFFVRLSGTGVGNGQTGMLLSGLANEISGDWGSLATGVNLASGQGNVLIAPYFENVKDNISADPVSGNAIGTVILGGEYEIGTNGTAFKLGIVGAGGTQNTSIMGARIKGASGGSGRVAFALGNSAYGLTVLGADMSTGAPQAVDRAFTGTWRGGTGGATPTFNTVLPMFFDGSGNVFVGGTATAAGTLTYTNGGGLQIGAATNGDKGAGTLNAATAIYNNGRLFVSSTAPTISSGFGSSPSVTLNNGTAAFRINVGTGGTASSGVIGLPTAPNAWNCYVTNITTQSSTAFLSKQTASSTTSATIGNFNTAGAAAAWVARDIIALSCFPL